MTSASLGGGAPGGYLIWVISIVVGALVYRDVLRRDTSRHAAAPRVMLV